MTKASQRSLALQKEAKQRIRRHLNLHDQACLAFSGGKDSIVIYDLCKEFKQITNFWVNTGSALPHMEEFIKQFDVIEVNTDKDKQNLEYGYPVDLVPVVNNPVFYKTENLYDALILPKLQDWRGCCAMNRWRPFKDFVESQKATLLIHGQRETDNATMVQPLQEQEEISTLAPIWEWTDRDVYEYIEQNKLPLPDQYPETVSSFDCYDCTAIDNDPEWFESRYEYLKKNYPEQAEVLRGKLYLAGRAMKEEHERVNKTISYIVFENNS